MASPYTSIAGALEAAADRFADRPALRFPHQDAGATFAEWWEQARRVAAGLHELGTRPGDHVALLAENRFEWPVIQAGVAALGAVLVPLNTHYRERDLAYALDNSEARLLFYSAGVGSNDYQANLDAIRDDLPGLRHLVALDSAAASETRPTGSWLAFETFRDCSPLESSLGLSGAEVGSLQYTSGTTGFPKGALLTHQGMLDNAWCTAERLRFTPEDRITSIIPLFHCAGCIMSILGGLQKGACYVGVPRFEPRSMFETIETERCTVLAGVPTSFLAMLNHPDRARYDLSSLRTGTCGGADADPQVLVECARELPIPELVQVYGQTESSTLVTCPWVDDPARFETAGTVLDDCELRITDSLTGQPLGTDEIGQIEMRGPVVMAGYHRQPEATAETITSDGWLRTGDLGYLRDDGRLVIAGGRLRDMIIRGGENIYPVEVENCLREHPAIDEIAVFGLPDEYYGERVGAAVRLHDAIGTSELVAYGKERIAAFKVPVTWFGVEDFPLTASGKIRKVELRAMAASGELAVLDS